MFNNRKNYLLNVSNSLFLCIVATPVDEEALLDLQGQIIRGMMLLEEGEPKQAQVIFEKAVKRADELGNIQQKGTSYE